MPIRVQFDDAGRTYEIEPASVSIWNVHIIARLNGSLTVETDLKTGEKICVTWSQIGVIRLVSPVDEKGVPMN
jgi:hypothetical protein